MKSSSLKIITALFILTAVIAPLSAAAQQPPPFTSPTIDVGGTSAVGGTNQSSGLTGSNAGSGLSATGIQTPNSQTAQTNPPAFTSTGNEFNVGSGGPTGNTSSGASASAAQSNTGTGSSFSWSNLIAAIDPITWVPKALDALMELVVLPVAGAVLAVAGLLFDKSVLYSLDIYNLISGATGAGGAIVLGWTVIRDIFNMMFIFSIIWISIETMLDLGKWHGKQVLTKVIIAAILINFSFFITEVIIDAGNIFATWFYNGIQTAISTTGTTSVTSGVSSIAGALAASLGLFGIYGNGVSGAGGASVLGSIASGGLNASVNQLLGSFIRLGVVAFATYIFAYVAVLFFARTISLMFSLVLSPVGFAGSVLPQTQEYSKKWWDELLKDVLLAPVFLLFLYVIIDFTTTPLFKGLNFSTIGAFDVTPYFKYFLLAGMLLYALKMAKKFSGSLGESVSGIAKQLGNMAAGVAVGTATGGIGLAARATIGRAGAALSGSDLVKNLEGNKYSGLGGALLKNVGAGIRKTGESASKQTFDTSGIAEGALSGIGLKTPSFAKAPKGGFAGAQKARTKAERERAAELYATDAEELTVKQAQDRKRARAEINTANTTGAQANVRNRNRLEANITALDVDIANYSTQINNAKTAGNTVMQTQFEAAKRDAEKRKEETQKEIEQKKTDYESMVKSEIDSMVEQEAKTNTSLASALEATQRLENFARHTEDAVVKKTFAAAAGAVVGGLAAKGTWQRVSKENKILADQFRKDKETNWAKNQKSINALAAQLAAATAGSTPPPTTPPPTGAPCWVAEVLYGVDDQKTHAARLWAATNDNWFTRTYRTYGRSWAKLLITNGWAQIMVKPVWNIMAMKGRGLAIKIRNGQAVLDERFGYLLEKIK